MMQPTGPHALIRLSLGEECCLFGEVCLSALLGGRLGIGVDELDALHWRERERGGEPI